MDKIVTQETRYQVSVDNQEGVEIRYTTDACAGEPYVSVNACHRDCHRDVKVEIRELHVNELAELIAGLIELHKQAVKITLACYNREGRENLKRSIDVWDFGSATLIKSKTLEG